MKKILSYKMGFYPKPYNYGKNKMKVELDLSNHPAKFDLKKATSIDISKFAKKSDLANLKSDVNRIDNDKLETTPL